MTTVQTVVVTIASLGILALVLGLIRHHLLREKYATAWILVSVLLCSMPWLFDYYVLFASAIGFVDSTTFFLCMAVVILIALVLQCTLALTAAFRQRRAMAQHIAILEKRLSLLEVRMVLLTENKEIAAE